MRRSRRGSTAARPRALFHAALEIRLDGSRWIVEQAPAGREPGSDRGVVATGPVGARWAGRLRIFRYEVRLWEQGRIPDIGEAVGSPRRISGDPALARRALDAAPRVPPLVWGRDEIGAGEMWNSNAVIAWILARSGVAVADVLPPAGGRAPGWGAGALLAAGQG